MKVESGLDPPFGMTWKTKGQMAEERVWVYLATGWKVGDILLCAIQEVASVVQVSITTCYK